ncbi:MAG: hypothetical protein ACK6DZ_16585 [Acidobacteriota bacterium]
MANSEDQEDHYIDTNAMALGWLDRELRGLSRVADLRSRQAVQLVYDFLKSPSSVEDFSDRTYLYEKRWANVADVQHLGHDGLTDDEALKMIDAHNEEVERGHPNHSERMRGGRRKGSRER